MYMVVQVTGSLLILIAFVLAIGRRLQQDSYPYLLFNVVGSGALAATAVAGREWGFILLEGVWALVSAASIGRRLIRSRTRPSDARRVSSSA